MVKHALRKLTMSSARRCLRYTLGEEKKARKLIMKHMLTCYESNYDIFGARRATSIIQHQEKYPKAFQTLLHDRRHLNSSVAYFHLFVLVVVVVVVVVLRSQQRNAKNYCKSLSLLLPLSRSFYDCIYKIFYHLGKNISKTRLAFCYTLQ